MIQFSNGRFFKELSHPHEKGCRYELLYLFKLDKESQYLILPEIRLDFTESHLHCYINYEDLGRPAKCDLFNISLISTREIDRSLNHILCDDDPLQFFLTKQNELAVKDQLPTINFVHDGQALLDNLRLRNTAFYFFFEDFENGSLFHRIPQYDEVYAKLHNNFLYRAILYKLNFLRYKAALSLCPSEIDEGHFLKKLKNSIVGRSQDAGTGNEKIPQKAHRDYLQTLKEWTNILLSDEFYVKTPVDKMNREHFFQDPEAELFEVTRITRNYDIEAPESDEKSKKDGKNNRRRSKKEKDKIEIGVVQFLLKRYNVLEALKISTNYNYLVVACCCLSLLVPFFYALFVLIPGKMMIDPSIFLLSGLIFMAITAYLVYWGTCNKSLVIKLMFPRLIIAIFSGWMIFVTAQELVSTEIDIGREQIGIGICVIIVTCAFMYNGVVSVAPYYDKRIYRSGSKKGLYKTKTGLAKMLEYVFNRITMLVAASFMIAMYIGVFFQVFFIANTIKQDDLLLKNMEEVKSVDNIRATAKDLSDNITHSILSIGLQSSLLNILTDFNISAPGTASKNQYLLPVSAQAGSSLSRSAFNNEVANKAISSVIKESQLKMKIINSWKNIYFDSSISRTKTKIALNVVGEGKTKYAIDLSGKFMHFIDSISGLIDLQYRNLVTSVNFSKGDSLFQNIYRVDSMTRDLSYSLLGASSMLNSFSASITSELNELNSLYTEQHICSTGDEAKLICEVQKKLNNEKQMWVWCKSVVIFPKMLIFQSLFAMFFGIFFQLVLHDKTMTESL